MTKAKIVDFLIRQADRLARLVVKLLPRIIKYWTLLMAAAKYTHDNPQAAVPDVSIMDVIGSLQRGKK